ncbi:efflux RND transporter periplasmic adaptor subunit [Thermotoga sp. SG1]|uniref:efflux RND transporter periplasmic adaptor subunit n=1 Tax=Thermotoga sp. SG1 TaxID=126739 RepID=UPI000C762750|nr:efflux RND transporter periplasmic adaptor subunit [Thermotoga sp. SG1]PLV57382.1 RND transporter [Thermotoga sp. SG1]
MKKWITLLIIAILVVLLIVVIFLNKASAQSISENTATSTQLPVFLTYTVTKENETVEIVGQVTADTRSVSSKVSGDVLKLYVQEGERVQEGQKIAKIDDTDYQIEYLSALNSYKTSPTEINRLNLEKAKKDLENTIVTSPVSGVVRSVNVEEGDRVSVGTAIVEVVETDTLRVEGSIDEYDLKNVKEGMKVIFTFEQLGLTLTGKVKRISPVAETSGGVTVIPVEFSFDQTPPEIVIPGLTCDVEIIVREATDSFFVPKEAIRQDQGGYYVMKQTPEGPQKAYVEIGEEVNEKIEIKEGVSEGDVLLLVPSQEEIQRLKTRQGLPIFGPGGRAR